MMKKIVFISLAILYSLGLQAENLDDIFSGGRALYQQKLELSDYRLVLSVPKKVNSQWSFDRSESLQGSLEKRTIELSQDESFSEAKQGLENYLYSMEAQAIFMCSSLDCGSSNVWANEIFGVKQLYGLDASQSYQIWQLNQEGKTQYLIWYLSQRGNRRIYLQLELVTPLAESVIAIAPDPETLLKTIVDAGFYVVPDALLSQQDDAFFEALVQAIQRKPRQIFAIVGHTYTERRWEANQKKSEAIAQQFADLLIEKGIKAAQLKVIGMGSFAPQGKKGLARVEIVIP
ncbi:Outer membrane protein OmpA [Alteromonadaceae bacterium Bs31]|nr:Outer membrane protein OmpA [Alteromonadaceae bacterium Bs31]